jgi:hypothetical protein
MTEGGRCIRVAGDVTIDWMVVNPGAEKARTTEFSGVWWSGISTRAVAQPGGAALLAGVLAEMAAASAPPPFALVGPEVGTGALTQPSDPAWTRSYTSWSRFPEGDARAWRIAEFWGMDPGSAPLTASAPLAGDCSVVAIDDANLGFRDAAEAWPAGLAEGTPGSVLLKMSAPVALGPLWERLVAVQADRLTLLVPVNDLRKGGGQIGHALSWDRVFEEVDAAVRAHALGRAARVVVLLGVAGAVLVERDGPSTLVFDPVGMEGDWETRRPGWMMGYATCVAAALADALVGEPAPDRARLADALGRGLAAARSLHAAGYAEASGPSGPTIGFPFAVVSASLAKPAADFATFERRPGDDAPPSILAARLSGDLERVARDVVLRGPRSVLTGVPIERVGAWSSVDRAEIEGMRSVRNILGEYITQWKSGRRPARPLSIAVFGPPGAGKSFAIKQMAKVLLPGDMRTLEFNLSQFGSADELPRAFHEVRDAVLSQSLPLVFFDEFDTPMGAQPLGWLRYFLAPMQDGMFREEGVFHPIGPAVFVFAGGTSPSLAEFVQMRDETVERAAKKPDFVSRLRGYVNVLGPNPTGDGDRLCVVRRAFLLRSMLESKVPAIFANGETAIDDGVLAAFLGIERFLHGARSMEALLDMSSLAGKVSYDRASLPAANQLALHVDADRFLELVSGSKARACDL